MGPKASMSNSIFQIIDYVTYITLPTLSSLIITFIFLQTI